MARSAGTLREAGKYHTLHELQQERWHFWNAVQCQCELQKRAPGGSAEEGFIKQDGASLWSAVFVECICKEYLLNVNTFKKSIIKMWYFCIKTWWPWEIIVLECSMICMMSAETSHSWREFTLHQLWMCNFKDRERVVSYESLSWKTTLDSVMPISVPSAVLRKNGSHKYEPFSFFLGTTRWAYHLSCFCRQVPIIYHMQCRGNEMFGCEALLSRNLQNIEEIVTHELEKTQWVCPVKTDKGLERRKAKTMAVQTQGLLWLKKQGSIERHWWNRALKGSGQWPLRT